jgi:hypothetical protein
MTSPPRKTFALSKRQIGPWNAARGRWLVGLLVLAGVVALLVLALRENVATNATSLVLVVICLALIFGLVMPRAAAELLGRMTQVKLAGFEVSLERKRAQRVSHQLPSNKDDDVAVTPRTRTSDAAIDVLLVQDVARQRLRFARWILLELGSEFDYPDILAYLHESKLLDTDETRLILDLLNESISEWPEEEREPFLDAAWPVVRRLAPTIFDRYVRKSLHDAGWRISEYPQERGHRPDFLAYRDDQWVVAAARVADPWETLEPSRKRLAGEVPAEATRRVVIVPSKAELKDDGLYPEVEVVRLPQMLDRTA